MNNSSIIQDQSDGEKDDKGFTLIEILIAIVLVGILSAVAVVGISSLVNKGSSSACNASLDGAKAGSAVYFAEKGSYPATLALVADGTYLTLPTGTTVNPAAAVAAAPHPGGRRQHADDGLSELASDDDHGRHPHCGPCLQLQLS